MFFSIIIPVYNVEQYLRECLNSLLAQTYKDYELICINDGSTDGSLEILNDYKNRYDNLVIIDVENGGTAWARNHGIQVARGEYIWFVDSDDWILPSATEVLAKSVENQPDVVCFNGRLWFESTGKTEEDIPILDRPMAGWEYYNKYALVSRKFNFVCVVLRLYRRDFLISNALYFQKGISHEDNLWIPIVMYKAQSVEFVNGTFYLYRIREGSKMQSLNRSKFFDLVKVNNLLADFFVPLNNQIKNKTIYREISTSFVHLINMINDWSMNDVLDDIYKQIEWEKISHTVVDWDVRILFYLIKKRKLAVFYKLYYLDFYVIRKRLKKLGFI